MLAYPVLKTVPIFGTKNSANAIATTVTLASTYTNTKTFTGGGNAQLVLFWKYTTGAAEAGTTLDIQMLGSNDNVNYYPTTNESAANGTSTLFARTFAIAGGAGATAYPNSYRIDITYPWIKIQVAESGVNTNYGTLFMEAVLGGY